MNTATLLTGPMPPEHKDRICDLLVRALRICGHVFDQPSRQAIADMLLTGRMCRPYNTDPRVNLTYFLANTKDDRLLRLGDDLYYVFYYFSQNDTATARYYLSQLDAQLKTYETRNPETC